MQILGKVVAFGIVHAIIHGLVGIFFIKTTHYVNYSAKINNLFVFAHIAILMAAMFSMCGILWRNPGCVRLFAIIWAVVIFGYFGIGLWYFFRYMHFHANSILDGFFFYSNNYCFVGPDAFLTIWHIITLALIFLNLLMFFYVAYLLKYAHCVCFIPCSPNPCLKPPRPIGETTCCKKKPWIKRFLEPSQCCPPTKILPQCPPPCPQKPCPIPCPRINVEFIPIPGSQKLACPDRVDPNRQLPLGQQYPKSPQTQSQSQLQTQPQYQSQSQTQLQTQPQYQSQSELQTQPQYQTQTQPQYQSQAQQAQYQSQAQQAQYQSQAQPQYQSQAQPQYQPQTQPQYQSQAQPQYQTQSQSQPQYDPQTQSQPQYQTQTQPQYQNKSQSQPQYQSQTQPQYQSQSQQAQYQSQTQPQSQPQYQNQYQPQGQYQPQYQQQTSKCCSKQKSTDSSFDPNDGYCSNCSPQDLSSDPPSNLPPGSPPGPPPCLVPCTSLNQSPSSPDRPYTQNINSTNKGKKKKVVLTLGSKFCNKL